METQASDRIPTRVVLVAMVVTVILGTGTVAIEDGMPPPVGSHESAVQSGPGAHSAPAPVAGNAAAGIGCC